MKIDAVKNSSAFSDQTQHVRDLHILLYVQDAAHVSRQGLYKFQLAPFSMNLYELMGRINLTLLKIDIFLLLIALTSGVPCSEAY